MGYYPIIIRRANAILKDLRIKDAQASPGHHLTRRKDIIEQWKGHEGVSGSAVARAVYCLIDQGLLGPAGELADGRDQHSRWLVVTTKGRACFAVARPEDIARNGDNVTTRTHHTPTHH